MADHHERAPKPDSAISRRAAVLLVASFAIGCAASSPQVPRPPEPADADRLFELARQLDYRAPLVPEARSRRRDEAAAQFVRQCRRGDRRSCWRGLTVSDHSATSRTLAVATGRHCLAGDEPSCRALAAGATKFHADDARSLCAAGLAAACVAVSGIQRACDLGDASACFSLWSADVAAHRTEAVLEVRRAGALERAIAECTRGFPHSCALIFKLDPARTARWLPQLRLEAGAGCRLGLLHECELLATFASESFGGGNPRVESFAATQTCTTRGIHCEQLVVLHQPSGPLPDPIAHRDALEHHCQLSPDRSSCSRLVQLYLGNQLPEPVAGRGRLLAEFLATPQTALR